ncbi:NAD-dependent epimerase/dehydratase family protein [Alicyclobacillus sp. TC]|uniref:Dihydroflavonol-4-reductase n=3 Tax=Alicyclobacillus tolerans TaxID=90970 RepID=A0ABT9LT79_9BACL|nr:MULTISPECIES: hopanoid-associated sugar epimerase [Alicyclobacillus]MDP9727482.1 dihydroflavonol-4-reductase [Alicyclobacillus tengchongensis]QRF23929.1 NAD-dependent epimerase/dehydratase family protein [Alicyclobacillus sp. TC]SHJ96803.1 dihydroflavonol-4-reductase [Alicyclobacillus montanus]
MRAFVTGASGFIGYHVARLLLRDGHEVRALVRPGTSTQRLERLGMDKVYGDLTDVDSFSEAMRTCDVLFHVAAHYSLYRRDRDKMMAVNVEATRRLLEATRKTKIERIVYTSSTATVGLMEDGRAADETLFANPREVKSDYKRSKILAEELVLDACREGMDIVIVNPSTPVGPGDIKPTPTGRIVLDTMTGKMPAYVETGLNLVAVEDVAEGHLLAWKRGKTGERYILGNENLTFGDLVGRIARIAGCAAPRLRIPLWVAWTAAVMDEFVLSALSGHTPRVPLAGVQLARRPMYFTAQKAVRELGLPQTSIDIALKNAVEWFRSEVLQDIPERMMNL